MVASCHRTTPSITSNVLNILLDDGTHQRLILLRVGRQVPCVELGVCLAKLRQTNYVRRHALSLRAQDIQCMNVRTTGAHRSKENIITHLRYITTLNGLLYGCPYVMTTSTKHTNENLKQICTPYRDLQSSNERNHIGMLTGNRIWHIELLRFWL